MATNLAYHVKFTNPIKYSNMSFWQAMSLFPNTTNFKKFHSWYIQYSMTPSYFERIASLSRQGISRGNASSTDMLIYNAKKEMIDMLAHDESHKELMQLFTIFKTHDRDFKAHSHSLLECELAFESVMQSVRLFDAGITLENIAGLGTSFRFTFPSNPTGVRGMSILFRAETLGDDDYTPVCETALLDDAGDVCYRPEFGYDDVCINEGRWYTIIDEVLRVHALCNPPESPKKDLLGDTRSACYRSEVTYADVCINEGRYVHALCPPPESHSPESPKKGKKSKSKRVDVVKLLECGTFE